MGAVLLMALALSLDGFGVGLAYGLRHIRLSLAALGVIALCTILAMGVSMLFGSWVILWLKFAPARLVGALILVSLGSFQLWRAWRQKHGQKSELPEALPAVAEVYESVPVEPVFSIQLRFLGLVIQVMKAPDLADMDKSGGISLKESFLLGSALAVDAFASGIGAALTGMTLYTIGIVALTQFVMIRLGQELSGKIPELFLRRAEFLPGAVLIVVGLGKLI